MKNIYKSFCQKRRGECTEYFRPLRLFGIFIFALISVNLKAQLTPDIFIRTFATHDSVMIRWIPANSETWKLGNKNGYVIERFTTDQYLDLEGKDPTGKGTNITISPIFPLAKTDSTWNKLIREDKLNAFVFQSIFENESSTQKDPAKRKLEDETKFGFAMKACDLSVNTAKAHGLFFVDKTIGSGQIYIYRIRIATLPPSTKHNPGIATADENLSVLKAPDKIHGVFRNRKSAISFDVSTTREEYAGYIIERSVDSIHFQRVNSLLLTFSHSQFEQNKSELVYQDSLPLNHKTYWYRVCGFSYFGMTGPASPIVKGKGKEEWTAFPEIDTLYSSDNKTVEMKWHLTETKDLNFLSGFLILRSNNAEGPYSLVNTNHLDKNSFIYKDENAGFINYYMICSLSSLGDSAFSFPYMIQLQDNDPPPIPENLNGTIDTNGIVHLTWSNKTVPDLKGYRVFRCNSLKEEFYEVSDSILQRNNFTDTISIKTLTHNVYYCVRSVDMMYNNSKNSSPCLLKRPDKIPPVPVLVESIVHSDSTIQLSWIKSSSEDIRCVELIRKSAQGDNRQLGNWNGHDTIHHFTDFAITFGVDYSYSIIVTDSSGNLSTTNFPTIHFQPRIIPELKHFSAITDFEKRMITLSWDKPEQSVERYVIYKSKKGEALREWKTINGNNSVIADKELYPGNTYIYKVKAILKSGAESKLVTLEVIY